MAASVDPSASRPAQPRALDSVPLAAVTTPPPVPAPDFCGTPEPEVDDCNVGVICGIPPNIGEADVRADVAKALQRINLALYRELKDTSANPVIAGVLTATQLAQLMPVMNNQQQNTVLAELGLSHLTPAAFIEAVNGIKRRFAQGNPEGVKISQASCAYVQSGRSLNPKFEPGAARTVDFDKDAAGAANAINSDVKVATGGMIDELVKAGDVQGAQAALVAAVYVEAPWRSGITFEKHNSYPRAFTNDAGEQTRVTQMESNVSQFQVIKTPQFDALILPNGESGTLRTIYIKPQEGQSARLSWRTTQSMSFSKSCMR
jgi:serine protease inhibitor